MKLDDDLKLQLERIADLLKKFPEALHTKVFDLIVSTGSHKQPPPAADPVLTTKKKPISSPTSDRKSKKTAGAGKEPKRLPDLDLGHISKEGSFAQFARDKKPKTNFEFNAVALYYLHETLKIKAVNADHIYTCYDAVGRRLPRALVQSIRDSASDKGFININDWENLRLTANGMNLVQHDLPAPTAGEA
jgi:hypothetical protein